MGAPRRRLCATLAATLLVAAWSVVTPVGATTTMERHDGGRQISFLAQLRSTSRPVCLESWAQAAGLRVDWQKGDSWVEIAGSVRAVERSLGITIAVRRERGAHLLWAARRAPRIPDATCGEIAGFGLLHSMVRPSLGLKLSPSQGLSAAALLRAYDATPLVDDGEKGQGKTVVFFEADAYRPSDLREFSAAISAPLSLAAPLGDAGPVDGEADLDIETVHELVPDAHLVDIDLDAPQFAESSTAGAFESAFALAKQRWPGSVWNISIGVCERNKSAFNSTDLQILNASVLAAEGTGTTVFAASGDNGGLECMPPDDAGSAPQASWRGVTVPASLPAVTGVGGTTLFTSSSGARTDEVAWEEPMLSQGSGGGVSSVFGRPSWQTGPGTTTAVLNGAQLGQVLTPTGREVPDVSADADPATGNAIVVDGQVSEGGGTSLSTPIWTAIGVLLDQYLSASHPKGLGFLNPTLYALARQSDPYPPFHDVTIGGNDFYQAAPGYDMVTGLGTPDVYNLARDLRSAT